MVDDRDDSPTLKKDRESEEQDKDKIIYQMGLRNEELVRLLREHACVKCYDIGDHPMCDRCDVGKAIGPYKPPGGK